jgi:hypothetical protein
MSTPLGNFATLDDTVSRALARADAEHDAAQRELAALNERWPKLLANVMLGRLTERDRTEARQRRAELQAIIAERDQILVGLDAEQFRLIAEARKASRVARDKSEGKP